MRMKGFTPHQFAQLLIKHGWYKKHQKGSHVTYDKEGVNKIITIVDGRKEMSRPVTKRLLKDAGII